MTNQNLEQLKSNIELIADEYIVMMEDNGLNPMVEGDFVNHVISQVFNFKYLGNGTIINKRGICKYLLEEFGYETIGRIAIEIGREFGVIQEDEEEVVEEVIEEEEVKEEVKQLWKTHDAISITIEHLEKQLQQRKYSLTYNEFKELRGAINTLHEQRFELEMEIMHLEYGEQEDDVVSFVEK